MIDVRGAWLVVLGALVVGCGDGAAGGDAGDTRDTRDGEPEVELDAEVSEEVAAEVAADVEVEVGDVEVVDDVEVDAGGDTWGEAFAHVIPDDRLVAMRLDFAPGDWAKLLLDWQQHQDKNEYPAAFKHDDESLAVIGVRLKGLNSLRIPEEGTPNPAGRYPLKLDFNSMGGARFHGVDELSLNACGNDPSRMRDWLTAKMYNAMGVHAAHMGFAEVAIDGANVGPYAVAQVIDKRFLKERFGEADDADDGNLYKCVYNDFGACSLQWLGDTKADHYHTANCQPGFDDCGLVLQTNEDDPALNDYADLIHFLDVLHHTPAESFEVAFAEVFDVDHFLRLAAVAFATANMDSYFGKGHNYYLYKRNDGRFQMIPWDFDLAYEQAFCEADIGDPTCGQVASHPLVDKILSVPAWRQRYLGYLKEVATNWLTRDQHVAWIAAADAIVKDAVLRDPNPPETGTEATYASQIDPLGSGGGNLFEFVDQRRALILGALPE